MALVPMCIEIDSKFFTCFIVFWHDILSRDITKKDLYCHALSGGPSEQVSFFPISCIPLGKNLTLISIRGNMAPFLNFYLKPPLVLSLSLMELCILETAIKWRCHGVCKILNKLNFNGELQTQIQKMEETRTGIPVTVQRSLQRCLRKLIELPH